MNINSILTVNTTNQTSNSFSKTSNVDKAKSDDFENLMASQKSSTQSNTKTTNENKTEIIEEKDSTQKLYEDLISLLKTGLTKSELKAFEEKLKEILKMKKDGKPDNEIKAALKKLSLEIQEAKKRVSGQVIKEADNNTSTTTPSTNETSTEGISTFDTMVTNIENMLQELKDSSKNTSTNNKDEESDKSYDKLKMLLKMS